MSSSFFIRGKQKPKLAQKGKNAVASKRKVRVTASNEAKSFYHQLIAELMHRLYSVVSMKFHYDPSHCFLLQADGETGGKKARVKKPNSKYNEEISSESETERLDSNVIIGCAQRAISCLLAMIYVSYAVT